MTKLKTLKELIEENDDEITFAGYTEDVLQCSAREWIKALEIRIHEVEIADYGENLNRIKGLELMANQHKIDWIKHFFNLGD